MGVISVHRMLRMRAEPNARWMVSWVQSCKVRLGMEQLKAS